MKNLKVILSTILLISSSTYFAQKISLGPEIGVNLIPTEKTELGSNYQLGFNIGAQVKYKISENFSLSSGLYLTQKKKLYSSVDTTKTPDLIGSLFSGFAGGGSSNNTSEADVYNTTSGIVSVLYLQTPILANYEYNNINFYAGPYVGLLIAGSRKEVYETESTAIDPSSLLGGSSGGFGSLLSGLFTPQPPESSSYKSREGLVLCDLGATIGVGYKVDKLNFNLYYNMGFLDYRQYFTKGFLNYKKSDEVTSLERHSSIQFCVAYLFNIGGSKGLKNRYDLDIE